MNRSLLKVFPIFMVGFSCLIISFLISLPTLAESYKDSNFFLDRSQQRPPVSYEYNPLSAPAYPSYQDSYFTDDYGNILMIVNVLGEVNKPGQIVVRENADFSTIFALAGGLKPDANLTKVVVARQHPGKDGKQAYKVNLQSYYKEGDRMAFIALKPNDTIIIPEKGLSLSKLARIMGIAVSGFSIYNIVN